MSKVRYFNLTYGLDALQTGRWKLGRFDQLNDSYDCQPTFTQIPDNVPGGMEVFKTRYMKIFSGTLGLICYSKMIDDPVIWDHYAECHKGLALRFDFEGSEIEPPIKDEVFRRPAFIELSDDRYCSGG